MYIYTYTKIAFVCEYIKRHSDLMDCAGKIDSFVIATR